MKPFPRPPGTRKELPVPQTGCRYIFGIDLPLPSSCFYGNVGLNLAPLIVHHLFIF